MSAEEAVVASFVYDRLGDKVTTTDSVYDRLGPQEMTVYDRIAERRPEDEHEEMVGGNFLVTFERNFPSSMDIGFFISDLCTFLFFQDFLSC